MEPDRIPTEPQLRTPGVIARDLGVPLHRVLYIVMTRPTIRPCARAGRTRLFDRDAFERIRDEIRRLDSSSRDGGAS